MHVQASGESKTMTRREALIGAGAMALAAAGLRPAAAFAIEDALPPLPYPQDALAPVISARTIEFHYGKHHQGYLTNLKKMVAGGPMADWPIEKIMMETANDASKASIFNNAAQVWNHNFYWRSMKPGGASMPAELKGAAEKSFGSADTMKKELLQAAVSQFGSGYAWLVKDGDAIKVVKTPNAQNPMTSGQKPLATIDVWEHAYYLDYQNRRPDHVTAVIDKLFNWEFVLENLKKS